MRRTLLTLAALGITLLAGGCAPDTSGAGNLFLDSNCSGDGLTNPVHCNNIHPVAGPSGTQYRDSTWHQFDDPAWLNIE